MTTKIMCHRCTTKVMDDTATNNQGLSDEDFDLQVVTDLVKFGQSAWEDNNVLFQDDSGLLVCARHLVMPESL